MEVTATIFKKPLDQKKVCQMIEAGADVLRIKFAHVSNEDAVNTVKQIKQIIDSKKENTKILVDLPEHKIRLGSLEQGKEDIVPDKEYVMKAAKYSKNVDDYIPVCTSGFNGNFQVGDHVTIGDGEVFFVVEKIVSDEEIRIKFPEGGFVDQYRSLMSSRLADSLDHCSAAMESLSLFSDVKPEYVALSFVDSADYINRIRSKIEEIYSDQWKPKILVKIESPQGLDKIEEIAQAADVVVVARGDLGLTIDYTRVILEQKKVCQVCKRLGKPVLVATQVLGSCLQKTIPARSEIADLTNMVLDGVSGIWLSQETIFHCNPGQVIKIAKNIINTIEAAYEA